VYGLLRLCLCQLPFGVREAAAAGACVPCAEAGKMSALLCGQCLRGVDLIRGTDDVRNPLSERPLMLVPNLSECWSRSRVGVRNACKGQRMSVVRCLDFWLGGFYDLP
jgi:hypothetical protein